MTIETARDILSAPNSLLPARAVAFDGLFGWFSPGVTRCGVVMCGTLGFEQLAAYRAWRGLAEAIAATGCSCLRFDYPGEGDSSEAGAGRLAGLVAAVRRAARYLREEADAEEIVLVGLRFGAMVAALAAREGGVDRLILLAPFPTGRAYLREMKLQARNTVLWPGGIPLQSEPGTLNVQGFVLGHELIADIGELDGRVYAGQNLPDIFVVDKNLAQNLSPSVVSGAVAGREHFGRFNDLLSGEMNFRPVTEVVETFRGLNGIVIGFLPGKSRARSVDLSFGTPPDHIAEAGWSEEAVVFGDGLFGILCRSDTSVTAGCSVLLINSGTYVRSGPSRSSTRMARALAAQGVVSLRFDLKGMGDSPDRPARDLPVYNLDALEDVAAAVDRLRGLGDAPVAVVGVCSGAYLAFHIACRDERITDALLLNLYCFDWPSEIRPETVIGRPTIRSATTYARSLLGKNTWRRIFAGDISIVLILRGLLKAWLKVAAKRMMVLCRIPCAGTSVVDRVAGVCRRGGRFKFVYSADDPGMLNIEGEIGLSIRSIGRILKSDIEIIDRCDHNFSTLESQARILRSLIDLTDRHAGVNDAE